VHPERGELRGRGLQAAPTPLFIPSLGALSSEHTSPLSVLHAVLFSPTFHPAVSRQAFFCLSWLKVVENSPCSVAAIEREIRLPGALSAAEPGVFSGFHFRYSCAGHNLCPFTPAAVIVMGRIILAGACFSKLFAYGQSGITRAQLQQGRGFMCGAWGNPPRPCCGGHFTQPGPGAASGEPVAAGIRVGWCCSCWRKGSPLQA